MIFADIVALRYGRDFADLGPDWDWDLDLDLDLDLA
jgi:hypothetical protein